MGRFGIDPWHSTLRLRASIYLYNQPTTLLTAVVSELDLWLQNLMNSSLSQTEPMLQFGENPSRTFLIYHVNSVRNAHTDVRMHAHQLET